MSKIVRAFVTLFALQASCAAPAERPSIAAYRVAGDHVAVTKHSAVTFEVAEARAGAGLPMPAVTARITTVEALTSPSFAPLSGRIVEAKVHLGDHVRRGQQLVLVRTPDLATLERDVRSAELAVRTRSLSVERMRMLVDSRAGSENDLTIAGSELEEARLTAQAAKARLRSLQISRGKDETSYWVLASRSGTIVQLDATPGSQVGPERSTPVAVVADLAEVLAVADVRPSDAVELQRGTPAQLFPFGVAGRSLVGSVQMVSEVVDPDRQTVPVRVHIENEERVLRPNAYVDLSFGSNEPRRTVLVPAVSVVRDGPTAVVFVESESGRFTRRAVVVGRRTRDEVEVVSGVVPGEHVVTNGALLLLNAIDMEA